MQLEACRIIFASEPLSLRGIATVDSWLRDIIMSSPETTQKARFGPLRGAAESRLATLKIDAKDKLFEECPMEARLHDFVKAKKLLGLTAMDDELQQEACNVVGRVEEACTHPSETVVNWLLRLIKSSTSWLAGFRRRAKLPRSEGVQGGAVKSTDPPPKSSTPTDANCHGRLARELRRWVKSIMSPNNPNRHTPTDEELQYQARWILYDELVAPPPPLYPSTPEPRRRID